MNTKKYIEATLINLLKKKSIDKIKVNEIIREVGTCKGTFYKYYRDKYELLYSCFKNNIYNEIISTAESWEEFMLRCLERFEQMPLVVQNAFDSTDVNSVRHFHENIICEFFENTLSDGDANQLSKVSRFTMRMCAINYTEITLRWLVSGMNETKEELLTYMRAAMPQAIYQKTVVAV